MSKSLKKLMKSAQEMVRVTAGRHPESPGQDATAIVPHPAPPPNHPHVRADTQKPLTFRLEKADKPSWKIKIKGRPEWHDLSHIKPHTEDHKNDYVTTTGLAFNQDLVEDMRPAREFDEKGLLKKTEPLEKKLIFEGTAQQPHRDVYRIENVRTGYGPYTHSADWQDEPHTEHTGRPAPEVDQFSREDLQARTFDKLFGFESPEQLMRWFSPKELDKMKSLGFMPVKRKATKVWGSGNQVFFEPMPHSPGEPIEIDPQAHENVEEAAWVEPWRVFRTDDLDGDLSKSFKENEWARILKAHDPAAAQFTDPTPYIESMTPHEGWKAIANSPKETKGLPVRNTGISAKMIHAAPEGDKGETRKVMTKPYHRKIESKTRSWIKLPILGWAPVANRALYDAAGIGDLCEEIGVTNHNGIPVTVHPFNPKAKTAADVAREHGWGGSYGIFNRESHPQAQRLGIQQIALMDFLTNNLDRHMGNIATAPSHGMGHMPFAIDHERSFQYTRTPYTEPGSAKGTQQDEPFPYLENLLGSAVRTRSHRDLQNWIEGVEGEKTADDLAEWWNEHKDKVMDAFMDHVKNIKNEHVRNHVISHFNERWGVLTDWATHDRTHMLWDEGTGINKGGGSGGCYIAHSNQFSPELKQALKALRPPPKPPIDQQINEVVANAKTHYDRLAGLHKLAGDRRKRWKVFDAAEKIIANASDEEVAKFFLNNQASWFKYHILQESSTRPGLKKILQEADKAGRVNWTLVGADPQKWRHYWENDLPVVY